MPHAYCTTCRDIVAVGPDGRCPRGHVVTRRKGGKHRAPSQRRLPRIKQTRPSVHPAARRDVPAAPIPPVRYDSTLMEMFGFAETPPLAGNRRTSTLLSRPPATGAPRKAGEQDLAESPRSSFVPSLQSVRTTDDTLGDTGTLVTRLWDATEHLTPPADWQPERFDKVARSSRTYRWSIIVVALLVFIAGTFTVDFLSKLPVRLTDRTIAEYRGAIDGYASLLPELRQAADLITDPAIDVTGLADGTVMLSRLDAQARHVFDVAAKPLPPTPPLVPRSELDALTPTRRTMNTASQIGLTVERRLADALTYRLLIARAFALPPLPTTVDTNQLTALGVDIGLAVSNSADMLSELPTDPFFAAHRQETLQLVRRLDTWQVEYLEALRTGDDADAERLVGEIEQRIGAVRRDLASPLVTLRDWTTVQIDTLGRTLDALEAETS